MDASDALTGFIAHSSSCRGQSAAAREPTGAPAAARGGSSAAATPARHRARSGIPGELLLPQCTAASSLLMLCGAPLRQPCTKPLLQTQMLPRSLQQREAALQLPPHLLVTERGLALQMSLCCPRVLLQATCRCLLGPLSSTVHQASPAEPGQLPGSLLERLQQREGAAQLPPHLLVTEQGLTLQVICPQGHGLPICSLAGTAPAAHLCLQLAYSTLAAFPVKLVGQCPASESASLHHRARHHASSLVC